MGGFLAYANGLVSARLHFVLLIKNRRWRKKRAFRTRRKGKGTLEEQWLFWA
jgi:hypothetical protein